MPALALTGAVLVVAAGCGSQTDYANDPRPPSPLTVTGTVSAQRVSLSPMHVGAGPIQLTLANVAQNSLDVTVEPVDAPGPSASSGSINPGGTATISFDAKMGTYRVTTKGGGQAAVLTVGRPRPSAQNDVLLP